VACRPGGGAFWEANCEQCHEPCNRERWGCDSEATEPVVELSPCPACSGAREACWLCDGTNSLTYHRCPNVLVTKRELDLVRAAAMVEQGVLPDPGGWLQQSAPFVAAYPIIVHEIRRWQDVAEEEARRRAEAKRR
jgi:hypothetical protein